MSFFQDFYFSHLKTINGVKFICREIDIIAFFICGRSVKKIASFFSISPKTVENHTHNIMIKLGCNSRENIIDFIEKSDKLPILREYYAFLLIQAAFEKCLRDVAKLQKQENNFCILTYWQEREAPNFLICHLETSLKLARVNVSIEPRNTSQPLGEICKGNYVVYVRPVSWSDHNVDEKEISLFSNNKSCVLLFLPNRADPLELLKEFNEVNPSNHRINKYYYFLTFEILKIIFPSDNYEQILLAFKKQYEAIESIIEEKRYCIPSEGREETKKEGNIFTINIIYIWKSFKFYFISILIFISLFTLGYRKLNEQGTRGKDLKAYQDQIHNKNSSLPVTF